MIWIIPIIVPLILRLIAKLFPYKPPLYTATDNIIILRKKYEKWEYFGLVLLFVFLPLMTWLFAKLFYQLNALFQTREHDVIFMIMPNLVMWCVPAGMLSFALIIYPMNFIYQLLLKDNYQEYLHFTNLKYGYDGMKVFKPIALTFEILAVAMIFLIGDYQIKITSQNIILNDLFTLHDKSYSYNQIESISFVRYRDNRKNQGPHYYIKFNDKNYWDTMNGLSNEKQEGKVLQFLEEKSGVKLDTLDYDPK